MARLFFASLRALVGDGGLQVAVVAIVPLVLVTDQALAGGAGARRTSRAAANPEPAPAGGGVAGSMPVERLGAAPRRADGSSPLGDAGDCQSSGR